MKSVTVALHSIFFFIVSVIYLLVTDDPGIASIFLVSYYTHVHTYTHIQTFCKDSGCVVRKRMDAPDLKTSIIFFWKDYICSIRGFNLGKREEKRKRGKEKNGKRMTLTNGLL